MSCHRKMSKDKRDDPEMKKIWSNMEKKKYDIKKYRATPVSLRLIVYLNENVV